MFNFGHKTSEFDVKTARFFRRNYFQNHNIDPRAHLPAQPLERVVVEISQNLAAGTDVMILKIFRRKIWRKYWRFSLKLQLVYVILSTPGRHLFPDPVAADFRKDSSEVIRWKIPGGTFSSELLASSV
jgi:hypothetical protein